ncbi:ATP-binding protein [Roseimarinus sediminis]|uniref:ATP-binding protein n=1 Tax=Roseimarinus sediminis TaxID=1610899 RepID=UPI003D24C4A9
MGQLIDFNGIPVPLLLLNTSSGDIRPNRYFMHEFDHSPTQLDAIKKSVLDHNEFPNPPESPLTINTLGKDATGYQVGIQLKVIQFEKQQLLITVQSTSPSARELFNDTNFKSLYNDIPLGIIIKQSDTNETFFVSQYLVDKIGYSFEEIASKPWKSFTYKDDIPMQESIMEDSKENETATLVFEKRIVSKSGKLYWFGQYIRNFTSRGKPYQAIVLRDITREKETEAELHRAKHIVEDAERLKSAFLDNMPHEIRTPLHAITGFTSLLSDSDLSHDERLEYVKFIQDSSNDILNLMDNIIEIAKLETNQVKPRKEKCYINSIIDKLYADILSKQSILEKEHLDIIMKKDNNDPLFMIISDPERIYQIISHLLNNALKFTDQGEIEFGYRLQSKNRIEFFVRDTGIGIEPREREIIFKKFGKSGNINTNKNRGSGLGLTLSKKLIELLNGEITLESEKNKGSTFRFHIPIENEPKISITKPSVSGDINWSSKTILIAEDTESNYFFIEAFLERTHVNLLWAQDGEEAVQMFKDNHVNLVLMDIMMPEKDGYDATREIKAINPDIPVIAQTALALPDDEEKCYNVGCDYVLVKPINSEDLIATIKRFIA